MDFAKTDSSDFVSHRRLPFRKRRRTLTGKNVSEIQDFGSNNNKDDDDDDDDENLSNSMKVETYLSWQ